MENKMEATIQVKSIAGKWVDCEHQSWAEIKEDGWVFEYATVESGVAMSRRGYLDVFRTNPKCEGKYK